MSAPRPGGVVVPLVTPLGADGTVDAGDVDRLVGSVAAHVQGLMPCLSTGEGWLLDERQWCDMLDATLAARRGLPVMVGVQTADPEVLLRRAGLAAERGVDAVVAAPQGTGTDSDRVVAHFRRLREVGDVPLFLYNETALSAALMSAATVARVVAECAPVVGIKDSGGDPDRTRELQELLGGLPVFQGWENLLTAVPTDGFIGPLANLEPELCAAVLRTGSRAGQEEVDRISSQHGIFDDEWYRPVKNELVRRGVIGGAHTVAGTARAEVGS